jgi:isopenicillin N synthase-like dioxygenase
MHDRFHDDIPLFDRYAGQLLLEKLKTSGMFVLPSSLPKDLVLEAHREARAAFLSPHLKGQMYDAETRTGYTPPGVEGTRRTGPIVHRHFFDYRPGLSSVQPMDYVFEPLYDALCSIAKETFYVLDAADNRHLGYAMQKGVFILRIAECLNDSVDANFELFPPHIDFDVLSLFLGGSSFGLEVEMDGWWNDVPLLPGDVLIGAGSLFKQYYPEVKPLRHRIMAKSVRRLSFFMFLDPSPNVELPSGETAREFFDRVMVGIRY